MDVTNDLLEDFAVPITKEPREIPLNGWEMDGTDAIGVINGESLTIRHWDDNPVRKQWLLKPGVENRWTLVAAMVTELNDQGIPVSRNVHGKSFEFEGLIKREDILEWYQKKFNIQPPEPLSPAPE